MKINITLSSGYSERKLTGIFCHIQHRGGASTQVALFREECSSNPCDTSGFLLSITVMATNKTETLTVQMKHWVPLLHYHGPELWRYTYS